MYFIIYQFKNPEDMFNRIEQNREKTIAINDVYSIRNKTNLSCFHMLSSYNKILNRNAENRRKGRI